MLIPKQKPFRSDKLRKSAGNIDYDCVMCGAPDIMLAHRNIPGQFGRGMKGPDFWAAMLCHKCHTYGDGKGRRDVEFWEMAISRTQARWFRDALLTVSP